MRRGMQRWVWLAGVGLLAPAALALSGSDSEGQEQKPAEAPKERVVEKSEGLYHYRLVIRPGNLQPGKVANLTLEAYRKLKIPDPVRGDRLPVTAETLVATVKAPAPAPVRGRAAAIPAPTRHVAWGQPTPATYGFHFTPEAEGVFHVNFAGTDARATDGGDRPFEVTFRIGAGSFAEQTETSQGSAAARRAVRRPVGPIQRGKSDADRLHELMEEVGDRFLALEDALDNAPARGNNAVAAAEARALAALFEKIPGLTPAAYRAAAEEFDQLAGAMPQKLEAVAKAAEGKDRNAPRRAFDQVELQGCLQCHAKFRFGVTTDLSAWPKFEYKPWKR